MVDKARSLIGRGARIGQLGAAIALLLLGFSTGSGVIAADSTETAEASSPAGQSPSVHISVDIRPGLCPNHIRLESALTIPIAMLGTVDFEVFEIDPATVRISRDGVDGEVKPVG